MSLSIIKHTGSTETDFTALSKRMTEIAAFALGCAQKDAPPGTIVEATTLAALVEMIGRAELFDELSDENFAQSVGMGLASAMMKREGDDPAGLDTRVVITALIRGFSYAADALAEKAAEQRGTRQ